MSSRRSLRSFLLALPALLLSMSPGCSTAVDPLARDVTIYRDAYGVPHIVGETEEATFFGYGYAQAEDHLERMMIQYRDAQGRRAEVEGFDALGDGYLHFIPYEYRWDGDYLQRLLRTRKAVIDNRDKIDPAVYRVLDGFARGVNAYIREHRAGIPAWIDSIAPEDVEALERSHYMRFYSIHDALTKMSERTYSFPNLGSNQWAIARERSANGRIIHVEHTHMPWANRFQNYEAHLVTPGKLNAGGISWFGSPFFLDGFNDKITWSATWNQPNMADVYEEKLNPKNHRQYLYDGEWRDIRIERETFRIKSETGMDSVTLPLYYTHHGPIVRLDRERNRAWSVKLPNFDGVNYSLGLYGLMKAQNLEEFKTAASRQLMPRWNLLYSDLENIYWVHNGNVAQRNEKYDWTKPVPGWTSETEWGPYLPFEQYPQLLNPASGFLQNCNNPPWVATRNSGLNPLAPTPYFLSARPKPDAGEEALNTRGERVFQVLAEPKKFTLEEMIDLGFDTYILPADVIVPLLDEAWKNSAEARKDARLAGAMNALRSWDRRSSKGSVAYTYLHYWGKSYQDLVSRAKFARFTSYDRSKIDIRSPEEQGDALKALREAVDRIEKQFGRTGVPWGEINVVVRGGEFPLGGEGMYGVLHPDEGVDQDDGKIHCNDGWGHLLIVMEGEPKQVWSLLPYGQSERSESPHYNDQAKLHSERKVKPFPLAPAEILENAKSVWGDRDRIRKWIAEEKNVKR
ncbi:MAG: penicillin acylase family protein [Bryobacteraceae bacterium]|nr:penicillin acylase family protein [Bryobacteraceae bacterium]